MQTEQSKHGIYSAESDGDSTELPGATTSTNGPSKGKRASHLFLVRLWADEVGEDAADEQQWQGKVQHIISGKAGQFAGWPALIDILLAMLPAIDNKPQQTGV